MNDGLSAAFSNNYEAAAWIIVALAHPGNRIARIRNFRVCALTALIAVGRKVDKALSRALS